MLSDDRGNDSVDDISPLKKCVVETYSKVLKGSESRAVHDQKNLRFFCEGQSNLRGSDVQKSQSSVDLTLVSLSSEAIASNEGVCNQAFLDTCLKIPVKGAWHGVYKHLSALRFPSQRLEIIEVLQLVNCLEEIFDTCSKE